MSYRDRLDPIYCSLILLRMSTFIRGFNHCICTSMQCHVVVRTHYEFKQTLSFCIFRMLAFLLMEENNKKVATHVVFFSVTLHRKACAVCPLRGLTRSHHLDTANIVFFFTRRNASYNSLSFGNSRMFNVQRVVSHWTWHNPLNIVCRSLQ